MYYAVGEAVCEIPSIKPLISGNSTCSLAHVHLLVGAAGRRLPLAWRSGAEGCAWCTGGSWGGAGTAFCSASCEGSPAALLIQAISSHWKPVTLQRVALFRVAQLCRRSSTPELPAAPRPPHQLPSRCFPFPPPQPAALTKVPAPTKRPVSHSSVNTPQQIKWLEVLRGSRPPKWKRSGQELRA